MNDDQQFRTPGHLISALLLENGWTQKTLAIILEMDEATVAKVISGKRSVDAPLAIALGEVFGTDPTRFLHLQKIYELAQARLVLLPGRRTEARARMFGTFPISDMVKRGWLHVSDPRDDHQVETSLLKFFAVSSLDDLSTMPHAAKKTDPSGTTTPAQSAWLRRVRQIASEMLAGRYEPQSIQRCIAALEPLRSSAEAVRKAPRILAEHGIRFAIVETIAKAKIDGVCMWLSPSAPVVAMSMRHDRIDNFWFVLRHELEHVLRLDGQETPILDSDLDGENGHDSEGLPEAERCANRAAAEFCVPPASMGRFIARKSPFFAERDVLGFANTIGVHPGIVAGQLQHLTGRYDRFRNHLVKVRAHVAPSAIVDGWGDVAPTEI